MTALPADDALAKLTCPPKPPLAVLATFAAQERCARCTPKHGRTKTQLHRLRLPPSVRSACEELKTRWYASLSHPSEKRFDEQTIVPHPCFPGWQATVALHIPNSPPFGHPTFLVELEGGDLPLPVTHQTDAKPGKPGLRMLPTEREREINLLVCAGKSNQEIALHTGLAVGSIKNSVHAIFKKLCVPSRTALSALLHSTRTSGIQPMIRGK